MLAAASFADGPYVVRDANDALVALSVDSAPGGSVKRAEPLQPDATLTIAAVGDVPSFTVQLRPKAPPAINTLGASKKTPLFVVADTHGEYEALVRMLQAHGVIGPALRWSFGGGRLLILGDVFDRGPNHLEILWLLYQLEAEATAAGGGVHLLLGNHETMVMMGDLRYLHEKYVETARVLGTEYYRLFDKGSVLGQWLRSKPAVMKVGRQLFLHAGISRTLVERKLSLGYINTMIRLTLSGTLDDESRDLARLLMTTDGPLWYRGFFAEHRDFTTATSDDVDAALKHFAVDRIFVGHTIVPTITSLFDGRVIALNVPAKPDAPDSDFEALLLRGGKTLRAKLDGTLEPL